MVGGMAALAAARLRLKATFQDVDREALQWAKSFAGKESILQICETLPDSSDASFDIIYVDNVIEHVPDPRALLQNLYARLAPGRQLLFKTPLARNTEVYLYPRIYVRNYLRNIYEQNGLIAALSAAQFRPWTLDPPRHLYAFSSETLRRLAEQVRGRACIEHYRIPVWEYSSTPKLMRVPESVRTKVKWLVRASLAPVEVVGKLANIALRTAQITSPGGVILRIEWR